jgi:hypothetical protein
MNLHQWSSSLAGKPFSSLKKSTSTKLSMESQLISLSTCSVELNSDTGTSTVLRSLRFRALTYNELYQLAYIGQLIQVPHCLNNFLSAFLAEER